MNIAYSRLKRKLKYLNIRAYTWDDVARICQKERITIHSYAMNESVKGYYSNELRRVYRKRIIVLNSKLSEFERLFVALHEIVHHFLHVSTDKKQMFHCRTAKLNNSKQDVEADNLALMMAIPQPMLLELAEASFEDINPFLQEKLVLRRNLFEKFDARFNEI